MEKLAQTSDSPICAHPGLGPAVQCRAPGNLACRPKSATRFPARLKLPSVNGDNAADSKFRNTGLERTEALAKDIQWFESMASNRPTVLSPPNRPRSAEEDKAEAP